MSKKILLIAFISVTILMIGMLIWLSPMVVKKNNLMNENEDISLLPGDTISWQTPTAIVVDTSVENLLNENNTVLSENNSTPIIPPVAKISGTALPSPPPMSKWQLASDYSFDSLRDGVLQSEGREIIFNVHGIVIQGEIITVFFSMNTTSPNNEVAKPETIQFLSDKKEIATSIAVLGEMENVVFGASTVHIPRNHSSQLNLKLSDVVIENEKGEQKNISGNWQIPLLEDRKPEDNGSYTMQIMMTKSNDVIYDKVTVFEGGPTKSIETGVGGRPDVTDGITRFFVFTLKSPVEQQGVYIFLMADGSVKKSSEKEYLEKIKMLFIPPTPVPPAKDDGIDAKQTPEPTPVNPPSQITLEEMLKRSNTSESTTE